MDIALADRLQFAFTIMFHYLFPIATMGLAPFIAWFAWRGAHGDAEAKRAAHFWTKIFAINFAAGVVTGIPMEFQFGTNWAAFSAKTGGVIGQPLAMEGTFAFFLESIFLGILLYGGDRVTEHTRALAAAFVCLGAWLSGFFIVATDAWMQHPVGYVVTAGGRIEMADVWAVLFSRFALWQYLHVMMGALVAGSFIIAGTGAYYLLAKRDIAVGRRFVRAGVLAGAIFSALVIFPTGDRNSADVSHYQPVKLAAMEGLFASTKGAPLAIIGMPDSRAKNLLDPIFVPDLLSFLAYGDARANVSGLNAYAVELWPPVEVTYYAYHIMVGLGTIFIAAAGLGALLLFWGQRLYRARPLLWLMLLLTPFPYIANEAGWVVSEVGRQPWIVYGVMRTIDGASPNVSSGETIFTLLGFVGMYFLIGVLFLFLTLRQIGRGRVPIMPSVAFGIIAFMLGIYVLLDGFDLGIAAIAPLIGRTTGERESAMHAIGPFWNGNEVWLIAAGGALFALFPQAYASAFSGFYMPFMIVLWLLMFRGIAMELRAQFTTAVWRDFWDFCFSASSALLILLFGVALGNVVRGVPLDRHGYFIGSLGFLLNPYALLVGIAALAALAMHGAIFARLRIDGEPAVRARALVPVLAIASGIGFAVTTAWSIQIEVGRGAWPPVWTIVLPLIAFVALIIASRSDNANRAFAGSSAFIAALFTAAATTIYPYLLPAFPGPGGITAAGASPSPIALTSAIAAIAIGLAAVCTYGSVVLLPLFREKVRVNLNL